MSPTRRVMDYRSYLTETAYDPAREEFVQVALDHPGSDLGGGPQQNARPARRAAQARLPARLRQSLDATETRIRAAHASHLGYPYNLVGSAPVPPRLSGYLINNLGDPYAGLALRLRGLRARARGRRLADGPVGVRRARRLLGLGRGQRHRGQPLGALPGARGAAAGAAALQPRSALLDPEGRPHPAHRRGRGRRHAGRRHRPRGLRRRPRRAGRRSADRGADLRHDGQGRARRHRRRPRLPRRRGHRRRPALRPSRRRAERHGAAVRRRDPAGDPSELPPRDRQHLDLGPQDDRHADALRRARRPAAPRRPRRLGDRLPALERHDADGLAQRPRRARALGAAPRPRRQRVPRRRRRLPRRAPTGWPRRSAPPGSRCCATRCR